MRPAVLLASLALAAAPLAAQQVRAVVDRNAVALSEPIELEVVVAAQQAAPPRLPELKDFDVQAAGTGTNIQMSNGSVQASTSFRYLLFAKRAGSFEIGPISVELAGKTYQTEPIKVRVTAAANAGEAASSQDAFITAEVSSRQPYLGEQVVYIWRFFHAVQIGGAQVAGFEAPGFQVEDLGELREYNTVRNGRPFIVHELRKALFPQQAGKLSLNGPALQVQLMVRRSGRGRSALDSFFGTLEPQVRTLRPQTIELEVRSLPPAPSGFSGLVGKFSIDASLSKSVLAAGDSTALRVTIAGTGNAQMITEPKLGELPGFKVYSSKPTASLDRSGDQLRGRKVFVRDLVPLASGPATVPGLSLVYFDPASGRYATATTSPFSLSVAPGTSPAGTTAGSLAGVGGKVAVEIQDELVPSRPQAGPDLLASGAREHWFWALGLLAPALAYGGVLGWARRHHLPGQDPRSRRRRTALKRSLAHAAAASRLCKTGEDAGALQAISSSLRELVGDKLGTVGSALTPAEVTAILEERQAPQALVERATTLVSALEAAHYGSGPAAVAELVNGLPDLLGELDRAFEAKPPGARR